MATQYLSYEGLQKYDAKIKEWVQNKDAIIESNLQALQLLVGNKSVALAISEAIAALINSAPQEFDTLKEVSDWIQGQKELNNEVSSKLNKISNIEPVSDVDIDSLFLIPVILTENQTITDAIGNLQQGEKLVLTLDTNENIDISQDCVIEANSVTFSGTITINNNASVTFIGAIFEQPVIIA